MLIIELISLRTAKASQETELLNNLNSIATQKQQMVEQLFAQEKSYIQIYGKMPEAINSIETLASGFAQGVGSSTYKNEIIRITPLLESIMTLRGLHNVYVVSSNGDIVFSNLKNSDLGTNLYNGQYSQTHLGQLIKKTFAENSTNATKFATYNGDNEIFSAFIATPISQANSIVGALVFQITPNKLNSIAQDYTSLETTGETVLARLNGDKVQFITPLRFNPDAENTINIPLDSISARPIREAVQGVNGQGESVDYRGIPILAAWRYLPQYNIGMVIKIDQQEAFSEIVKRENLVYLIALLITIPCIILSYFVSRRFTRPIISIVESTKAISRGDLEHKIAINSDDEIGQLADSINEMSDHINNAFKEEEGKQWLQRGVETLSQTMRGNQISTDLSDNIVAFVSHYLNAKVGSMYIVKEQELELAGGFAFVPHFGNQVIAFGDGLVGQIAITKQHMMVTELPEDYASISSSLGEISPKNLLVYPIIKEDIVHAVIELGWISDSHTQALEFLDTISESVATALGVADSHHKLQVLLDQSQQQMEELQVREEELRAINEEVEQRSKQLAQSQKDLERQSSELKTTNDALEQKTLSLESKNQEIERSKEELEVKAEQLEASSKYKSEFLANMSHELRTPLNSMLILSRILADNDEGNLDDDQIESAQVINNSGHQLLSLINDILDLSKIEAGKMEVHFEDFNLTNIVNELASQFKPIAGDKGLQLVQQYAPEVLLDQSFEVQKTQQILKNLLSNALKFTDSGSVTIDIAMAPSDQAYVNNALTDVPVMALSIIDTGIGISDEKIQAIFEAFQQEDGSTSRKYGGTGLGLTISRHLTELIDGELSVSSIANHGSKFTLLLPIRPATHDQTALPVMIKPDATSTPTIIPEIEQLLPTFQKAGSATSNTIASDQNEQLIVIIEDDKGFSMILSRLAKTAGFTTLCAYSGKDGLEHINTRQPCGVILDLGLPDMSGSDLLSQLKSQDTTKNIPVHIVSGDTRAEELKRIGAQGYHQKPVDRNQLNALFRSFGTQNKSTAEQKIIIFDDSTANAHLDLSFLNHSQVDALTVHSFDELSHNLGNSEVPIKGVIIKSRAINQESSQWFDHHYQHLQDLKISVVLFVDEKPECQQKDQLEKYDCNVILDGPHSDQRLHDEVSLFLSQFNTDMSVAVVDNVPVSVKTANQKTQAPTPQPTASQPPNEQSSIANHSISVQGCNVLLVDDDLRNTFALSKVLKKQGMIVTLADNGQMAIDKLEADDNIDIVLMDIMMPVMDGHQAMRQIRLQDKYADLPIIALTAKAMQEDRRKCVEAGASDYLTKPIDVDKLVAMMKVWLYKEVTKV